MWLVCAMCVYQQPSTIYEVQCTYLVRHLNNSEYGFSSVAKFGQISSSPECLVFSTNPQPERRGEADDVQDDFIIINSQISIPFHSHFFNFQFHQSHLHLLIYFPIAQTIGARKKSREFTLFNIPAAAAEPACYQAPASPCYAVSLLLLVCVCILLYYIILLYFIILFLKNIFNIFNIFKQKSENKHLFALNCRFNVLSYKLQTFYFRSLSLLAYLW